MNITLKQLSIFVEIAQQGSITAAAENIFLSKPALSMALSELESQLNQKLFYRVKRRLILSEHGEILLPRADELLTRYQELKDTFSNPTDVRQHALKIGSSRTIGSYFTPFLMRDFQEQSETKNHTMVVGNTEAICQRLNNYEIDVALIEGDIHDASLASINWLQDEMIVVVNNKHPLAKNKKVSYKDLDNHEWVVREEGSQTRQYFIDAIASRVKQWTPLHELNTFDAIINAVIADLGMACLPKVAVSSQIRRKQLVALNIALKPRQFKIYYLKNKYQSSLAKDFIQFCQAWKPKV